MKHVIRIKGSYILKNALGAMPYCDLIGYWQLTDLSVTTFDTANKDNRSSD
jgi:xylan 1,4-beta-xylosidase